MDWIKATLLTSMAFVVWMLVIEWNRFEPPPAILGASQTVVSEEDRIEDFTYADRETSNDDLPLQKSGSAVNFIESESVAGVITVVTDVFKVDIDGYKFLLLSCGSQKQLFLGIKKFLL